jgi:hypothetical protein
MSRLGPHRSTLLLLALAAVVIVAGLVFAGLQTIPVRSYALRVPDSGSVGLARPSHRLCEGPITSPTTARSVGVFADPAAGAPVVEVTVFAGRRQIAVGTRTPDPSVREQLVGLDRRIPAGRAVRVCVRASRGALTVWGAGAQAPGVVTRGASPGMQFALVLTRPGTLLGSLSTAFTRAATFRPSWVGPWTFWLLVALLACTLPLAGVAITRALGEDEADES